MEHRLAHPEFAHDGTPWLPPPAGLVLAGGEVHLWRAQLDVKEDVLARLRPTLAADELARAARLRDPQEGGRYLAARGALRAILGRYLDVGPDRVRFEYNTFGKPAVKWPEGQASRKVSFNLSHSHNIALLAFTEELAVGVDVELVRPELAMQHIAEHFFSPGEVAELRSLPAAVQPLAFFQCWTMKEAILKARGDGLTVPLDRIEVALGPNQPPELLRIAGAPGEAASWRISSHVPAPGYLAALAVRGRGWRLQAWDYAW